MQINLLPGYLKKKKTLELWQRLKRIFFVFIVLWFILGGLVVFLKSKNNDFKKRIAKIKDDWKVTEPLMKEREVLIQQKKELSDFLVFIDQHLKKDILWSEKLTELSRIIPSEIWLRGLSLKKGTENKQEFSFLDLEASIGYLKSDEEMLTKINDFVERLKGDKEFFSDFENLSLSAIQKEEGGERVMNFRLTLPLKPKQ